ncbi:AbrB/MazE/SpoVT family DNA-binding domain-containing protein [Bacillus mangrovi]|uniref:AbrB/MazE/SpoVT family DNA-binding domain-containing protein n=1 Tax=Metabacillus mangrovi TaxID=1491830 RepID=A0A7X2S6R2_9BACI|nr:AbrB/MazE/SpoVT family DNA-binding domain-containing protein [Metabacillus mangrovi]MTH54251.1 AbrB/MazE/SpoVT family DNA-binding domain-containing protein [Metabacillus mangrovi]
MILMAKQYSRKVFQQGNSLGVGIPNEVANAMGLKKGEEMEWIIKEETQELTLRKKAGLPEGVSPEFLELLDGVLTDYDEALKNLKDR